MNAFRAIIGDTWRQSKNQWVMLVVLLCFGVIVWLALAPVETRIAPDGETILTDDTERELARFGLETRWNGLYASAIRHRVGYDEELQQKQKEVSDLIDRWNDADYEYQRLINSGAPEEEISAAAERVRHFQGLVDAGQEHTRNLHTYIRGEINREIEARTGHVSKLQKGAEWWLASIVQLIFTISMLGFIAVSAGYFPAMLEAGSVDLVLSKPIRRWQIFFGKYLGGLVLFSLVLTILYVIIFVGFGLKVGVWHWQFFGGLPMTLFSLALLFAIVAWVGLWTRSTSMAMVIGYVYYVVVDTAVGVLTDPAAMEVPILQKAEWLQTWVEIVKVTFPSFHWLNKSAESAVFSVMVLPWAQVGAGAAWLVIALATAYNRFRINDY